MTKPTKKGAISKKKVAPETVIVEYSSNNSGGDWWLKDGDWKALEKAGWQVKWKSEQKNKYFTIGEDGRWLGALATRATRSGLSMADAISEWERITGQDADDEGCNCCGSPHSFSLTDGDKTLEWYEPSSRNDRYPRPSRNA